MKARAVICDIYGTLLRVGPPPVDAPARWLRECKSLTGQSIPLHEFNIRCAGAIASQHALRRASGEPFPEVDWPAVVQSAVPSLTDNGQTLDLSVLHAACSRTCVAMPGSLTALKFLTDAGVLLGLASNAQHYTRDELTLAGFSLDHFHPALSFLSGDHGFAKPSPRVFQFLTERLASLGILPSETLMIGDSMENDILPARAAGWQTQLISGSAENPWSGW